MPLLSSAQLLAMQTTQDSALPGTAVIYRADNVTDGMGGFTETWNAVGMADGRLRPIISRGETEYVTGSQVAVVADWFVTMPIGTDVTAKDRIRIGGRAFEVSFVNNDESWRTACRAECISINEEEARQLAVSVMPAVGNPIGLGLLFTYPSG